MKANQFVVACVLILFAMIAVAEAKKTDVPLTDTQESHHSQYLAKEKAPDNFESSRFRSRKADHNEANVSSQIESNARGGSFTRTEKRKSSVIGEMFIGAIMFFAGFPCIWYNERGYAKTKTFLNKYVKICAQSRSEEVDPNLERKLVCIQGTTTTNNQLTDNVFGVSVNQSIKLKRKCEILSWVETRSTNRVSSDEDEVTYTYDLQWTSQFIDSKGFAEPYGHENQPGDWLYDELEQIAPHVTYGAYTLSETQKEMCYSAQEVPIPPQSVDNVSQMRGFAKSFMPGSYAAPPPAVSGYYGNAPAYTAQKTAWIRGNHLMITRDSASENAGDFRISFTRTPCGPITVVGEQRHSVVETFKPEEKEEEKINDEDIELESGSGCCGCCGIVCKVCKVINQPISEINWVSEAHQTKIQMFQSKLSDFETKTWIFRLVGFLLFMFGVYLMLSPVYTLLYWFPLVGRYLGTFGSFICGLVGFLIAIPFTIITISIAWLFYRKEIGIPLLLVSLAILGYFLFAYEKDYKGEQQPQFMF